MTNTSNKFRKGVTATIAAVTLATSFTFNTTQSANAGSKDFWAGAAAGVVTGAIVSGAHRRYREPDVVYVERRRPRTVYIERSSRYDRHVAWCYNKYASYHEPSDTFQPYVGGRRYCNSPYN